MDFVSEAFLRDAVFVLVRLVEAAAVLVIFAGAALGFARFAGAVLLRRVDRFTPAPRLERRRSVTPSVRKVVALKPVEGDERVGGLAWFGLLVRD